MATSVFYSAHPIGLYSVLSFWHGDYTSGYAHNGHFARRIGDAVISVAGIGTSNLSVRINDLNMHLIFDPGAPIRQNNYSGCQSDAQQNQTATN
mgnify:CR=1 FL=1